MATPAPSSPFARGYTDLVDWAKYRDAINTSSLPNKDYLLTTGTKDEVLKALGPSPAIVKPPTVTEAQPGIKVVPSPGVEDVQAYIESKVPPSPTAPEVAAAKQRAAEITGSTRTPGGQRTPVLDAIDWLGRKVGLADALLPQQLATPGQKKQAEDFARFERDFRQAEWDRKVKERQAKLDAGIQVAPLEPDEELEGDANLPTPGSILAWTLTSGRNGGVSESPVGYGMRLLASPVSAAVGTVEAAVTDKDLGPAVSQRVAGGMGIAGAGGDIGEALGESAANTRLGKYFGITPEGARTLGFGLGFIGDLFVPIDLGAVGAAGGALRKAKEFAALDVLRNVGTAEEVAATATHLKVLEAMSQRVPGLDEDVVKAIDALPEAERAAAKDLAIGQLKAEDEAEAWLAAQGAPPKPIFDEKFPTPSDYNAVGNWFRDMRAWLARRHGVTFDTNYAGGSTHIDDPIVAGKAMENGWAQDGIYSPAINGEPIVLPTAKQLAEATAEFSDYKSIINKLKLPEEATAARPLVGRALASQYLKATLEGQPTRNLENSIRGSAGAATDIARGEAAQNVSIMSPHIRPPTISVARLSPDELNAVARNMLVFQAAKDLDRQLLRVGRDAFIPASEKAELIRKARLFTNEIVDPKQVEAVVSGRATLTPRQADELLKPFSVDVPRPGGVNAANEDVLRGVIEQRAGPVGIKLREAAYLGEPLALTAAEWNSYVTSLLNHMAEVVPGKKSLSEVSSVRSTRKYVLPEQLQWKPLNDAVESAVAKYTKELPPSPLTTELVDGIRSKLGGLNDDFKYKIRQARASGLTPSQAFSKVMLDEYELGLGLPGFNAGKLFDDWMVTLYGGYEQLGEVVKHFGGESSIGLKPKEVRDAFYDFTTDSPYAKLREQFSDLVDAGHTELAFDFLGGLSTRLQDVPASKLTPSAKNWVPVFGGDTFMQSLGTTYLSHAANKVFQNELETWGRAYNIIPDPAKSMELADAVRSSLQSTIVDNIPMARTVTADDAEFQNVLARLGEPDLRAQLIDVLPVEDIITYQLLKTAGMDATDTVEKIVQAIKPVTDTIDVTTYSGRSGLTLHSKTPLSQLPGVQRQLAQFLLDSAEQSGALQEWAAPLRPLLKPNPTANDIATMARALNYKDFAGGIVEQVSRVPSVYQDSRRLATELRDAVDVSGTTTALQEVRNAYENVVPLNQSLDLDSIIKEFDAVKNIPPRVRNTVFEYLGERARRAGNIAKSGVLGGALVPNLPYHMANALSAPAIIWQTLGGRTAIRSLWMEPKSLQVMKNLFGKGADVPLFTTEAGKVYTSKGVADLIAETGIARSQASYELTRNVLEDVVAWSGRNARGGEVSAAKDWIRRMYSPGQRQNVFGEFANASDTMFRTNVLLDALKAGKTEEEAVQLARTSLFDYGKIPTKEREYIARYIWFYSFMRHNMVTSVEALVNNPSRAVHLYKLSQGAPEDGAYHLDTRDYLESKPFLALVKSARGNYSLYGPKVPMVDALTQLVDIMSILSPLFDKSLTGGEAGNAMVQHAIGVGGSTLPPKYATALGIATGRNIQFGQVEDVGTYIDPKFLVYLSQNQDIFDAFTSVVRLEPTPADEVQPGDTTFHGIKWRIPKGDTASQRNWYLLQQAMLGVGLQRAARDYAPMFVSGPEAGTELQLEGNDETLRNLGIVTSSKEQNLEAQRRQAIRSELKGD